MYIANVFQSATLPRLPAFARLMPQHWIAWLRSRAAADTRRHTNDSAAMLYARAAKYEATQPGFASDLRAAAEAMDRLGTPRMR
jgi:hypothetical protein